MQVRYAILISLEQLMPRPRSGLLKNMFRLSKVARSNKGGRSVFHLHYGAEYHIGFQVLKSPKQAEQANDDAWMVKWARIASHATFPAHLKVSREWHLRARYDLPARKAFFGTCLEMENIWGRGGSSFAF
jgi:hypothetical protein